VAAMAVTTSVVATAMDLALTTTATTATILRRMLGCLVQGVSDTASVLDNHFISLRNLQILDNFGDCRLCLIFSIFFLACGQMCLYRTFSRGFSSPISSYSPTKKQRRDVYMILYVRSLAH
jgi:hypothetical protein